MTLFMLLAGVLAWGLVHAWRLAVPPRADLVARVGRWDAARARANRLQDTMPPVSLLDRLARRLADVVTRRGRDLTNLNQDLAVTEATLEAYLSRTLILAGLGFLAPVALFGLISVVGLGVPVGVGMLLGAGLAATMVVATNRELREQAGGRRAELRRALSVYLDLVAMSLEAGRAHAEALPAAAQIGTGWAFTWLQDATVEAPRWDGITAWAALGRLGERVGMSELVELEGTLTLAQDDGAKVKASLIARAQTLRAQRVADAEAAADKSTESMRFAVIVMAFAFITYEFYPAVSRLFAG